MRSSSAEVLPFVKQHRAGTPRRMTASDRSDDSQPGHDGRDRAQEAICHVKLLDSVVLDAVVQNNGSVCAMTIREPSRSSGNC
jgi:hypothetical protein